ncbi:RidA family protein [Ginsengibacter hankyongi]|uniref:RidA family protein n=1 Tax=Ginsengibacter hankyongi TaxID=2607284 RepID=A0A5J5IB87_9BACT|nr:RidA family protein [Ginsengibacter hankyongi]KAA9034368.1 RidA family protein [Ginsengibacter hankyongi]
MTINPFAATDKDRAAIWEILVTKDIRAFVSEDWSLTEGDFIKEGFMAIDGNRTYNPDAWTLAFCDLRSYKAEWLRQASAFREAIGNDNAENLLHRATILRDIEIKGDVALAHKKFIWDSQKLEGERVPANWQSIYHCRRVNGSWKIAGFTGYLPNFIGSTFEDRRPAPIEVPANAAQHKTSGPYSPVLMINPGKLVVISGQAAIDMEGKIIGDTIEEQAAFTLENCRRQLAVAGCSMDKVFKVTVYLKNIEDWGRFNKVYIEYFREAIMPVRTAVQAGLLSTLLVEVECWAVL